MSQEPQLDQNTITMPLTDDLTLEPAPARKRRGRRPGVRRAVEPRITRELPKALYLVWTPFRDDTVAPAECTVHIIGATLDPAEALDWLEENQGARVLSAVVEP